MCLRWLPAWLPAVAARVVQGISFSTPTWETLRAKHIDAHAHGASKGVSDTGSPYMSIGGHTAHRRLSDFCVMSPENSQSAPALASKRTLDVVKGHVVPRDCILPAVRMSGMLVHVPQKASSRVG